MADGGGVVAAVMCPPGRTTDPADGWPLPFLSPVNSIALFLSPGMIGTPGILPQSDTNPTDNCAGVYLLYEKGREKGLVGTNAFIYVRQGTVTVCRNPSFQTKVLGA